MPRPTPISRRSLLRSLSLPLLATGCAALDTRGLVIRRRDSARPLTRIALGSCLLQTRPQPVWWSVLATAPDLFIHLGDNIYADTLIPGGMVIEYRRLWSNPGYQALRRYVPVLATWDDHDYGWSDSTAGFLMKDQARRIFCDFFGEPPDSPRRHQAGGIYASCACGPPGRRVRIMLLDVRWDRSAQVAVPWEERTARQTMDMGYLMPDAGPAARMLGEEQWRWLESELRKPAELRIIASGTRVLAENTGYEQWANYPRERQRLFDLIRRTGAGGVLFVSGDPHISEYSLLAGPQVPYPLWEVTSSSLNQRDDGRQRNSRRVVGPYGEPNFGLIEIDWAAADPEVRLETRTLGGDVALCHTIRLGALRAPSASPAGACRRGR